MSAKNEHGLTPKQEEFAKAIASGMNQSDAYRKAYPASKLWKDDSVHTKASAMNRNVQVKARVLMLAKAIDAEFAISTSDLLRESARIAFSDVRKIISNGKVLLPDELDGDTGRAVSKFKIDEYGRIEYQFWDKNSALERLFKHKGLFAQDNKQQADALGDILKGLNGKVLGVTHENPQDAGDDDQAD